MESKYSNKNFEQYVKENADQYRMFPSDKVWKGVNNALHTRRKWYGFWLGFLLLLTVGAVTWVMTTYPSSTKENSITLNTNAVPSSSAKPVSTEKASQDIKNLLPFTKDNEPATIANSLIPPAFEKNNAILLLAIENDLSSGTVGLPASQYYPVQIERTHSSIANSISKPEIVKITSGFPGIEETSDDYPLTITTNNNIVSRDNQAEILPLLTIESVTNAYQFKKTAKKISWQLFITPTVSYRKLSVNKSSDNPSAFNYPFASLSDVNKAVTHKPDLGLQIGLSGRYPLTNALKLRGGVQFNINRYDIKAYAFNGEVARIDLNGQNGNSTISTWTNYRNFAGYKSDWLKNYYFSISVPIGAEIKLIGNNKTNFGIAGTLQPTYILKDRAYLISTDYKNYAEVPRLVRHVNLNTSFETFINYTNGKTKWQVGPQVRYQILSSFHNKYPVKENLFDFGVKLGVTLNE